MSVILSFKKSILSPLTADTFIISISFLNILIKFLFIFSSLSFNLFSSTKSILFITQIIFLIPSDKATFECSSVIFIQPSFAQTTSIAKSKLHIPATMFLINLSCPGTSITPIVISSLGLKNPNPKSIVISLFFSSGSRIILMRVNALINSDFPWSTCPAVPIILFTLKYSPFVFNIYFLL